PRRLPCATRSTSRRRPPSRITARPSTPSSGTRGSTPRSRFTCLRSASTNWRSPAPSGQRRRNTGSPSSRTSWAVRRRAPDLRSAAAQIRYPVVLKAIGPGIVHKSELQAVRVDLRNEKELADAASQMERHLRDQRISIEGFLVQEFVKGGMEVVLGMSRDKVYGPFLLFGLGGVYVEYLKDVAFGLPPLTDRDAMRMIESIRTYPMLRGVRGQAPR